MDAKDRFLAKGEVIEDELETEEYSLLATDRRLLSIYQLKDKIKDFSYSYISSMEISHDAERGSWLGIFLVVVGIITAFISNSFAFVPQTVLILGVFLFVVGFILCVREKEVTYLNIITPSEKTSFKLREKEEKDKAVDFLNKVREIEHKIFA